MMIIIYGRDVFQLGRSSEYIYYLSSANHENARISESILVYTKAIYYSIFTLVVISNTQYTSIQCTYIDCNCKSGEERFSN